MDKIIAPIATAKIPMVFIRVNVSPSNSPVVIAIAMLPPIIMGPAMVIGVPKL